MPKTIACGQGRASASTTVWHLYVLLVASLEFVLKATTVLSFGATGATVVNFACLAQQAPFLAVWRQNEFGAK
jgi:hypothetical protein